MTSRTIPAANRVWMVAADPFQLTLQGLRVLREDVCPMLSVIGRCVLARKLMQGTCKYVVSSRTPPESVITTAGSTFQRKELNVGKRIRKRRRELPEPKVPILWRFLDGLKHKLRLSSVLIRGRHSRISFNLREHRRWMADEESLKLIALGIQLALSSLPPEKPDQRVDHYAADEVNLIDRHTLTPQVLVTVLRRRE